MCDYPGCATQNMPFLQSDNSVENIFVSKEKAGMQWIVGYFLAAAVVVSLVVTLPLNSYCFMSNFSAISTTIKNNWFLQLVRTKNKQ